MNRKGTVFRLEKLNYLHTEELAVMKRALLVMRAISS